MIPKGSVFTAVFVVTQFAQAIADRAADVKAAADRKAADVAAGKRAAKREREAAEAEAAQRAAAEAAAQAKLDLLQAEERRKGFFQALVALWVVFLVLELFRNLWCVPIPHVVCARVVSV